ncbi:MAG: hypothetical protein CMJ78_18705 [Planctomycetaceae bacterium]|nr:hypothetical protein [Planctomycetaceae bacterium]
MKIVRVGPLEIQMSLSLRLVLLAICHLVFFAISLLLAFALRFDFEIPVESWSMYRATVSWICGLKLTIFYLVSHYHGWWRFVTFSDLAALLRASTLSLLVIAAFDYILVNTHQIPRSVLLLDSLLSIILLGGFRSTWRLLHESFQPLKTKTDHRNALIVGADVSTGRLAQQIQLNPQLNCRVIGFIDSDPTKRGSMLGGIPVLGDFEDVETVITTWQIDDVLVVDKTLGGWRLRGIIEQCEKSQTKLKVIPPIEQLLSGETRLNGRGEPLIALRDLDINDVLRRDPVQLDVEGISQMLQGRDVMVTGAGGSIGSEICRQIMTFQPRSLILVERFENNLFMIERELRVNAGTVIITPCIADVTDEQRMREIFKTNNVEVVFHAAAHKHVPMMELNPGEAIKNNVLGTKCVADLADQSNVTCFALISTDKAVNPSSVMGVTKQLAERYIYAKSQSSDTRFVAVRFGNVLGSASSVIPIFQEQIRRGGPITVTHPEMKRYFMTIPEASRLVLQAAALGNGGEIFVLDMGEPVRIVDLAVDLIRIAGLHPDEIEIVFTGMRPGEKLFEELYLDEERLLPCKHSKIFVAAHRPYTADEVAQSIAQLAKVVHESDSEIRRMLQQIVLEYIRAQENLQKDERHGSTNRIGDMTGTRDRHRPPSTSIGDTSSLNPARKKL